MKNLFLIIAFFGVFIFGFTVGDLYRMESLDCSNIENIANNLQYENDSLKRRIEYQQNILNYYLVKAIENDK